MHIKLFKELSSFFKGQGLGGGGRHNKLVAWLAIGGSLSHGGWLSCMRTRWKDFGKDGGDGTHVAFCLLTNEGGGTGEGN